MSTIDLIAGTSAVRARRTVTATRARYRLTRHELWLGIPAGAASCGTQNRPRRRRRGHGYPANVSRPTDVKRTVALVTLGCARNEVDSEELAARLGSGGWQLTDSDDADIVVVNTCGFVDAAKKDSIDTLLAAADSGKKVVAVGCLAERYGAELAASLPEADAVLGFDSYADIAARLDDVAAGRPITPHKPRDRRTLLPIAPAARRAAVADVAVPGHAWLPTAATRTRLSAGPVAYAQARLGLRPALLVLRHPLLPRARSSPARRPTCWPRPAGWPSRACASSCWSARTPRPTARTSATCGCWRRCCPSSPRVDGIDRVRVSYLQPAELRPACSR